MRKNEMYVLDDSMVRCRDGGFAAPRLPHQRCCRSCAQGDERWGEGESEMAPAKACSARRRPSHLAFESAAV
eukprot:scaffold63421_cov26-Tisochrysis_lutea.AAC.1